MTGSMSNENKKRFCIIYSGACLAITAFLPAGPPDLAAIIIANIWAAAAICL